MSRYGNDLRVVPDSNGGYTVTTSHGAYHVLDSGALGWGIYTGKNLDLVFSQHGPVIGAADPDDLIAALLDNDQAPTSTTADTTTNDTDDRVSDDRVSDDRVSDDRVSDDCDGM